MRFCFQDDTSYAKSAASASRARSFGFSLSRIFLSLLDHTRQQRQKHLRVLLRIAFQCRLLRVALANSQRSANLLGNHHSSQFVDSPHYARCSHKYAASFYSAFCPLSQYGFKPAGLFAHKRWQRLTNHVSFANETSIVGKRIRLCRTAFD